MKYDKFGFANFWGYCAFPVVRTNIRCCTQQNFRYVYHESKIHGANLGHIWGRRVPCGPHVCPMNFAIWVWLCTAPVDVQVVKSLQIPESPFKPIWVQLYRAAIWNGERKRERKRDSRRYKGKSRQANGVYMIVDLVVICWLMSLLFYCRITHVQCAFICSFNDQ